MGANSEVCRSKSLHPSIQADDVLQVQRPFWGRTASPALGWALFSDLPGLLGTKDFFGQHHGSLEHLIIMVHLVPEVFLSTSLCWFLWSTCHSPALPTPSHCWTVSRISGQNEKTSVHLTEVSHPWEDRCCWHTDEHSTELWGRWTVCLQAPGRGQGTDRGTGGSTDMTHYS